MINPQEAHQVMTQLRDHILHTCIGRMRDGEYVYFDVATEALVSVDVGEKDTPPKVVEIGFELGGTQRKMSELPVRLRYEVAQMLLQLQSSSLQSWVEAKMKEEAERAQMQSTLLGAGHPMNRGIRR